MPVAPPQPLNQGPVQGPLPVAGQPAGNPVPLQPPGGGALDQDYAAAQQASADSDKAISDAEGRYQALKTDFENAQKAANDPTNINAPAQLQAATTAFNTAQNDLANANTASANAKARMVAAGEAAASRAKDPDLKEYYLAHADQARAQGDLAQAQIQALNAKTPADVAQAMAAVNEANARAQSLGILTPAQAAQANADAAQKSAQASQISALTPGLAREQGAKATVAEATAAVAPQVAQTNLAKAQADVDQARANIEQTQRQIAAMPTEQQAQAAIDLGLKDKQADLDAKQQQLQQAQALMPTAVAQAQTNVQATQANIQATQAQTAATQAAIGKGTLGPLYGIGDQIQRLRGMIANGQIQPQDADTALNTFLNSQIQGATPFQQEQEQNRMAEAQRQQDVGLTQARLQAGQAYASNMANQFGQLAQGAGPGFGNQMAAGFQAALNMGRQFFGQMGGMQNPAPLQSATQQAPTVHINIGGGDATSAPQPQQNATPNVTPTLPGAPPALPAAVAALAVPPAATSPLQIPNFAGEFSNPYAQQAATAGTGGSSDQSSRATTPFSPSDVEDLWSGSGIAMPDGRTL